MSKIRNKRFWERVKPESKRIQATHKIMWVKTLRQSRAGVEHFFYRPVVVPA